MKIIKRTVTGFVIKGDNSKKVEKKMKTEMQKTPAHWAGKLLASPASYKRSV